MKSEKITRLISSAALSVLLLPLLAILPLFTHNLDFSITETIAILSGILSFIICLNTSSKESLKTWGTSILFTILFEVVLLFSAFDLRLTNFMIPEYGLLSAGGNFAKTLDFLLFSVCNVVGCVLAILLSKFVKSIPKWLEVLKRFVIPFICIVIIVVMIYLMIVMPSAESIYAAAEGMY